MAVGGDGENGCAGVFNQTWRKDRVIVHRTAIIVLTGNISSRRNRDDTWHRSHGVDIHGPNTCVRDGAESECGVQRVGWERNVVGVLCPTAYV